MSSAADPAQPPHPEAAARSGALQTPPRSPEGSVEAASQHPGSSPGQAPRTRQRAEQPPRGPRRRGPFGNAIGHGSRSLAPGRDVGAHDVDGLVRTSLFVGILLVFWITLEPFKDLSDPGLLEPTEGSDIVNQLLFVTLFGLCAWTLVATGWQRIRPLLHPAYAAVLAWFLVDCAFGIHPGISFRRLTMTVIVMAIVGMIMLLPRNQRQFETWIGGVALTVVLLCYATVALLPHLGVHQGDAVMEVNLAGDWRGLYGHKSLCGPMMVVFVFIGVFLARTGRLALGLPLALSAAVFLLFTGAKQPQALVLFVFAWSWLVARTRSTPLLLALCLGPLCIYLVFTVGSTVIPPVAAIDAKLLTDPTFTNRTGIWTFAIDSFLQRPIVGYGFHGFWGTEYTMHKDRLGPDSWTAAASHSHNSYLDLALTTGLPGLVLACWALLVLPLLDFAKARRTPENRVLASLFLQIWMFGVFLGSMETLFFRRDDAFWVCFLIAAFGLRYLAAYRVRAPDEDAHANGH